MRKCTIRRTCTAETGETRLLARDTSEAHSAAVGFAAARPRKHNDHCEHHEHEAAEPVGMEMNEVNDVQCLQHGLFHLPICMELSFWWGNGKEQGHLPPKLNDMK